MGGRGLRPPPTHSSAPRPTVSPHRRAREALQLLGSTQPDGAERGGRGGTPTRPRGLLSTHPRSGGDLQALLSSAGQEHPQGGQMSSSLLPAPLLRGSREVSARCSPWERWQAPARPQHRPGDVFTNPSASNFFLFSMICRESTKSRYPQGSCCPQPQQKGREVQDTPGESWSQARASGGCGPKAGEAWPVPLLLLFGHQRPSVPAFP